MSEGKQNSFDNFKIGDNYETIEFLGSDDTGVFYKAKDIALNTFVSIKIIKIELTNNEKFLANLSLEMDSVYKLEHENISGVKKIGKENNKHYIIMEFVDGKLLSEILKEKHFSINEIIEFLKQLALAIEYASSKGIIHRAIKPDDIFITRDNILKLSGFGFSKAMSTAWLTITGTSISNVEYMSPEQAEGEEIDHRTDIYSFGIIAYEMLTGSVPFKRERGSSILSLAMKHINSLPEPLKNLNTEIPDWLESIVLKCLEKKPSKRFNNGKELFIALEQHGVSQYSEENQKSGIVDEMHEIVVFPDKSILKELPVSEIHEPEKLPVFESRNYEVSEDISPEINIKKEDDSIISGYETEPESDLSSKNQNQLKLLLLLVIFLLFVVIIILFYIAINR